MLYERKKRIAATNHAPAVTSGLSTALSRLDPQRPTERAPPLSTALDLGIDVALGL